MREFPESGVETVSRKGFACLEGNQPDSMKMSTDDLSDLLARGDESFVNVEVLERLFDEAPDVAFFIKDEEGRYLSVNQSLVERHGFSRKNEMTGKRPSDICPGAFGEVPAEQDAKVISSGRALVNHLEMQWLQPHRPCWCLTTKLPLRRGSKVIGLVGFSRDLREEIPVEDIPGELALALEKLEKQCGEKWTPAILAKDAGMTAPRLARLMKRVFGVTSSQYISRTRIQVASRMLRESNASIATIALDCGFSDHSAFTRAFRSTMGLAPTQYREQMNA
jgi:PAS domain S-box-containing protein